MNTYEDVTLCDECMGDLLDDDAAPSCGTHRLHIGCAPWFGCQECDYIRMEVCS